MRFFFQNFNILENKLLWPFRDRKGNKHIFAHLFQTKLNITLFESFRKIGVLTNISRKIRSAIEVSRTIAKIPRTEVTLESMDLFLLV